MVLGSDDSFRKAEDPMIFVENVTPPTTRGAAPRDMVNKMVDE